MKFKFALAATLAGSGLVAFNLPEDSFNLPEDSVEFRPAEGTTLTKTFVTEAEFALEDMVMTVNGEEMDPEMMGAGGFNLDDATAVATMTLVVTDEYVKMGENRPAELLRSYDSMNVEYELGDGESGSEDEDELVGNSVRFTWDEEDETFERALEGDAEVEEELMQALAEDLDIRALLPGRAVSEGDSWEVSWGDLGSIMIPGFDMQRAIDMAEEEEDIPFDLSDQMDSIFGEASLTCTYQGIRDADGTEVGVIEIETAFDESVDLTDPILTALEEEGGMEGFDPDLTLIVGLTLELEGELLWNLRAGHGHAMSFDAEFGVVVEGEMYMDMQGMGEMDMSLNAEASGTVGRVVSFEAE